MGNSDEAVPTPAAEEMELTRIKLRAEIDNLKASAKKALAEAANADAQHQELIRRRNFFERILSTTQFTVLAGLATVIFQIFQLGYTGHQTRLADEDKRWKDSVSSVNFEGDSKAVSGALDLETFFQSPRYGDEARTLEAAVVPFIKDNSAFDHLYGALLRIDSWADGTPQIFSVAKDVSSAYEDDASAAYPGTSSPVAQGLLRDEVSGKLGETLKDSDARVEEAGRREWQIDTVTHGLLNFWAKNNTRPKSAPANDVQDLQTVILRLDDDAPINLQKSDFARALFKSAYLHHVDFSGASLQGANLTNADLGLARLTGTNLSGAKMKGANLDEVTEFQASTWTGVDWWDAAKLSPQLCAWLGKNGADSGPPLPPHTAAHCVSKE